MTTTTIVPETTNLKEIIKSYLNTIVYIDDIFGLSLVGENAPQGSEIQVDGGLRRKRQYGDIGDPGSTEEKESKFETS